MGGADLSEPDDGSSQLLRNVNIRKGGGRIDDMWVTGFLDSSTRWSSSHRTLLT
jgi:hypothetical protein